MKPFGVAAMMVVILLTIFFNGGMNITSGNISSKSTKRYDNRDTIFAAKKKIITMNKIGNCSSWMTYAGKIGGRRVMRLNDKMPEYNQRKKSTDCAQDGGCYPVRVKTEGIDVVVEPGVHSFTITSLFALDEFHVALEGPELSPTFIEGHGNGTYTASYCVELPGFYKLYVRILQINGEESLRKDVFQSPFHIRVQAKKAENQTLLQHQQHQSNKIEETQQISALDPCTTARQATQGRWVHFDQAEHYSLVHIADIKQWGKVLEVAGDKYVWIPYLCRLRPMTLDDLRPIFQNQTHCLCCDSYIRTLFSDTLYVLGILNSSIHGATRKRNGGLSHANWEFEGVSMSWHDIQHYERCLQRNPDGVSVENILTEKPPIKRIVRHSTMLGKSNSSGSFVLFVGHPWSGDHRTAHRKNHAIQLAQMKTFDQIGPEIDVFDAFAFTYPRIYHEACDGSHVSCVVADRLTPLAFWEILILAQLM